MVRVMVRVDTRSRTPPEKPGLICMQACLLLAIPSRAGKRKLGRLLSTCTPMGGTVSQ